MVELTKNVTIFSNEVFKKKLLSVSFKSRVFFAIR